MKTFETYFMWFLIYSVIGWLCETVVCSLKNKKFSSRGFMFGPYCPVYGIGALINVLICSNFNNPILTFAVGSIVALSITFITSYSIEKISGFKICDRANQKLCIGGHASVVNALVLGVISVVQVMFIHPLVEGWVSSIHPSLLRLLYVLFVFVFVIDIISAFVSLHRVRDNVDTFHYYCKHELRKDVSDIEKEKRNAALRILGTKQTKLADAYPSFKDVVYNLPSHKNSK